jgi:hypothetical protein
MLLILVSSIAKSDGLIQCASISPELASFPNTELINYQSSCFNSSSKKEPVLKLLKEWFKAFSLSTKTHLDIMKNSFIIDDIGSLASYEIISKLIYLVDNTVEIKNSQCQEKKYALVEKIFEQSDSANNWYLICSYTRELNNTLRESKNASKQIESDLIKQLNAAKQKELEVPRSVR